VAACANPIWLLTSDHHASWKFLMVLNYMAIRLANPQFRNGVQIFPKQNVTKIDLYLAVLFK